MRHQYRQAVATGCGDQWRCLQSSGGTGGASSSSRGASSSSGGASSSDVLMLSSAAATDEPEPNNKRVCTVTGLPTRKLGYTDEEWETFLKSEAASWRKAEVHRLRASERRHFYMVPY